MEYFLAVVENKGINGAAAALGVAQPTVSQALRGLERELGVRLFHRIGRGMVLSAAGRSLVGPSRQVLRDVAAAAEQLTASDGAIVGRLDIMAFPALTSGTIVDLIAEFCRRYPQARVRFSELEREDDLESLIRDGHCEFAVAHLPLEAEKASRSSNWGAGVPPGLPGGNRTTRGTGTPFGNAGHSHGVRSSRGSDG